MNKEQKETLRKEAVEIERRLGLRRFGDCPICADHIVPDGSCCYCDWNSEKTPEETAQMYNEYWNERNDEYKRPAKQAEDFMEKQN